MAVNKVIYGSDTLIDLTADTVTADKLKEGETAHSADGVLITGTMSGGGGETTYWNLLNRNINASVISSDTVEVDQGTKIVTWTTRYKYGGESLVLYPDPVHLPAGSYMLAIRFSGNTNYSWRQYNTWLPSCTLAVSATEPVATNSQGWDHSPNNDSLRNNAITYGEYPGQPARNNNIMFLVFKIDSESDIYPYLQAYTWASEIDTCTLLGFDLFKIQSDFLTVNNDAVSLGSWIPEDSYSASRPFTKTSITSNGDNKAVSIARVNSSQLANRITFDVNVPLKTTRTKLWENSNPDTLFADQTVTLSQSVANFQYIEIEWQNRYSTVTSTTHYKPSVILRLADFRESAIAKDQPGIGMHYNHAGTSYCRRAGYVSDTQVRFTVAYALNQAGTAMGIIIPLRIYGLSFSV